MIDLLTKYRTKIDWIGNNDWDTTGDVSFDYNKEGMYTAFFTGVGTLSKSVLEKGKSYNITFDIVEPKRGTQDGSIYIKIGGVWQAAYDATYQKQVSVLLEDVPGGVLEFYTVWIQSYSRNFGINNITIEEVGYTSLDIFQDQNISLNYDFKDIENPETTSGSYSDTFTLPGTNKNNRFFKNVFNINEDNLFNLGARCDASISSDGINILDGFIKLESILKQDDLIN